MSDKRELTDEEFIQALQANGGFYSRTASWIRKRYGFNITRQAVHKRAQNEQFAEILEETRETKLDKAEDVITDLFTSTDKRVRLQAATWYLRKQGTLRGFGDSLDINLGKSIKVTVEDQEPPDWLQDEIGDEEA